VEREQMCFVEVDYPAAGVAVFRRSMRKVFGYNDRIRSGCRVVQVLDAIIFAVIFFNAK
jgi:hypothetical protein